jgi:hypothetical protein
LKGSGLGISLGSADCLEVGTEELITVGFIEAPAEGLGLWTRDDPKLGMLLGSTELVSVGNIE